MCFPRAQRVFKDIGNMGHGRVELWWGKQMPMELWKGKLEHPPSDREDSASQDSEESEISAL